MASNCGCADARCRCEIDTSTPCLSIVGDGSPDAPWIVDLELDPDAANTLLCTASGLLGIPSTVAVEDTNCIDMAITGSGGGADPYTISAVPVIGADNDYLFCTADGLEVRVSEDADNQTIIGTDGGIYTPPATVDVQLTAGCGIEVDGLEISAQVDPDPCNDIECRPTGLFFHMPRSLVAHERFVDPTDYTVTQGAGPQVTQGIDVDIVNPDPCCPMNIMMNVSFLAGLTNGVIGQGILLGYNFEVDGNPISGANGFVWRDTLMQTDDRIVSFAREGVVTIPAGGTVNVTAAVRYGHGGGPDGTILEQSISRLGYIGVSDCG